MAVLRTALDDVQRTGRSRLVFVAGSPGMGKTRICEEAAASAIAQSMQVVWGRCYEEAGAPPFWPWVQILRSLMKALDAEGLSRLLGDRTAEILRLVPELSGHASEPADDDADGSPTTRFRLFDGIARLLDYAARRASLVIIFDDLHGADHSSLQLLQFVVRALREVPLLIVAAYRDVTLAEGLLTDTVLEALRVPGTERLRLSGLNEAEVARFVEIVAAVKVDAAVATAIHKQTEGNPLFVGEYARMLLAEPAAGGFAAAVAGAIPPSVRAAIGRRLAPLSEHCRAVLDVASLLGRDFRTDVLHAVVKQQSAERGAGNTDVYLSAALAEAVRAGVLVEPAGHPRRYRFSHALIRETLYEQLAQSQREKLHRLAGETLALRADSDEHLAEIAHHYFEAVAVAPDSQGPEQTFPNRRDEAARAVEYAQRAAERAAGLLAYEESARLYQLALQMLPRTAGDEALRCELLLSLAAAQQHAGQRTIARQTYRQAAELARILGLPEALARAALGDVIEGYVAGSRNESLVALLQEAFDALGEEDTVLKATIAAQLATALSADNNVEPGRSWKVSEQAVAIARRVGHPEALAQALLGRHWVLGTSPNVQERLSVSTEAVETAKRARNLGLVMSCRELRIRDLLELGDVEALDREIDMQGRDTERVCQPVWRGQLCHLRAVRAMLVGQLHECERLAYEGFAIGQHINLEGGLQLLGAQLLQIRHEQGRLEEIESGARATADQHGVSFRCAFVYVLAELQRTSATLAEFERLAKDDFAPLGNEVAARSLNATFLTSACVLLRDARRAAILYAMLLPYAGRNVVTPFSFVCFGSASHPLGLLAATMGQWTDAARHFDEALDLYRRMGAPLFATRTRCEYAAMLLAHCPEERPRAIEMLEMALAAARELGLPALEQRAVSLRAGIDGSHPPMATAGVTGNSSIAVPSQGEKDAVVFKKAADYWVLEYRGVTAQLRHRKGLEYLAYLLRHPNRDCHVFELLDGMPASASAEADAARPRADLGQRTDRRARHAYRERLHDLRAELEEAERDHDLGRAERLRSEFERLADQLRAAFGRYGNVNQTPPELERARSAVGKRIRAEIAAIAKVHPTLGRHLRATITTGYFCIYRRDP